MHACAFVMLGKIVLRKRHKRTFLNLPDMYTPVQFKIAQRAIHWEAKHAF